MITTVGFLALQFNTAKKQFVATRNVPEAVIHQKIELIFNLQPDKKQLSFEYQ